MKNIKEIYKNKKKLFIKIPPHSLESEQSLIGGLMLNNKNWYNIIEIIDTKDFFIMSHQIIFEEMKKLTEIGKPIDLITISENLNKKNLLKKIGGLTYLIEISKNTCSISNILTYSEIIKEKSILRKIINISNEINELIYNQKNNSYEDIIDIIETKIFKISEEKTKNKKPNNIKEILKITIEKIKKLYNKTNKNLTGISSGYKDIDEKTLGFQPSDLIILASRPSMGKTTLAINLCENISLIEKKPILIFSLEMPYEQIITKILSSLSKVEHMKIRSGKLNNEDWKKILKTINILTERKNIFIDDSSDITPNEIKSKSRKIFKENNGLSLIMIDYLQLIKIPNFINNRTIEITEISRSLKSLSKELKIPILALSQLNRSLELRTNKRPINSDLRESGSIEQDADIIMFIYRDEIYNKNNNNNIKKITELIISKHRNGPLGTIKLIFNSKFSKFENYYIYN